MNDIVDYDPLAAAKGESNSAMAKAAILREKNRAEKAAEEARIKEEKQKIRDKNTTILKEIAIFLGVPHDIQETDHDSKLILRKVFDKHDSYFSDGHYSSFSSKMIAFAYRFNNSSIPQVVEEKEFEKFRDVIQAAQEGGYTKLWLKRYWSYDSSRCEVECKYQTIYPERQDHFFYKSYQRRLSATLNELQEETIKMLAEEKPECEHKKQHYSIKEVCW